MSKIRITRDALYVGRTGVSVVFVGLVLVVAVAAALDAWWKALLTLIVIPLALALSWLEIKSDNKAGIITCPRCRGLGKIKPESNEEAKT